MKQTYLLDIVGNPEKKTVELRMQNETVTLTFTDKPIPAKPPGQTDPGSDWPTRSKIGNACGRRWKIRGRHGRRRDGRHDGGGCSASPLKSSPSSRGRSFAMRRTRLVPWLCAVLAVAGTVSATAAPPKCGSRRSIGR